MGYSVEDFADLVLMIDLYPWQRWLLRHLLELRPDGMLRFRTAIVLVARQNGKSTLSTVLALWFMYVYGVRLVIGTAQDLDVATEIWQNAVDMVLEEDDEEQPVRPELAALVKKVVRINGKESLVLKTGERWKVKAANRRAGRSLSGDVILLDELREHQSWDAWGALTKTTMARAMALVLALSNAGDATSVVLRYLRKLAHAALGDPDGINAEDDPASLLPAAADDVDTFDLEWEVEEDDLGIFEWSAPSGCAIHDREGWAQANPSLGYGITERAIASAARTDPEWVFRTEVLCQWSDGTLDGPFPPGGWEKSATEDALSAEVRSRVCVDVDWDRSTSYVGLAQRRPDGVPQVEVIASRTGTSWVIDWLLADERSQAVKDALELGVVIQARGAPASSLIKQMRDGVCRHSPPHQECGEPTVIEVTEWGGPDLSSACGDLYDRVRLAVGEGPAKSGVRHRSQPILDVAAANAATKPAGDAWMWDRRKSAVSIGSLVAVTGALWGLICDVEEEEPPPAEPQVLTEGDAIETSDLMSAGF